MSTLAHDAVSITVPSTVVRLELRARVLACIRGGLSLVGGVAAVLLGAQAETTFLGWAVGAVVVSIILAGDRSGRGGTDPEPLPTDAIRDSWAGIARNDVVPSTFGVALFTVIALAMNPVMAGVMAGILGGMAIMTIAAWVQVALAERKFGGVLYVERGTRRLYIAPPR
jgi:hypothetical protein